MKRKFLMSGNLIVILTFLFVLFGPANVIALPIFNADVLTTANYANVTFANLNSGNSMNVRTEYSLNTNLWGVIDAFCVQDTWAPPGWAQYELLPVTAGLNHAAWIADQYWNNNDDWAYDKEVTQIAIWEVTLGDNFTYNSGAYYSGAALSQDTISAILALDWSDWSTPGAYVSLAHNPVDDADPDYQDYLVNKSIPEPATMLLFGTGLIGLAGLGRRKFRKS